MNKLPFILALVATVMAIFIYNPSGNSWWDQAEFELMGVEAALWGVSGVVCAGFMAVMFFICLAYFANHKLRALMFLTALGGIAFFWVVQYEKRGASIMSHPTLVYCIAVAVVFMGIALSMSIKEPAK